MFGYDGDAGYDGKIVPLAEGAEGVHDGIPDGVVELVEFGDGHDAGVAVCEFEEADTVDLKGGFGVLVFLVFVFFCLGGCCGCFFGSRVRGGEGVRVLLWERGTVWGKEGSKSADAGEAVEAQVDEKFADGKSAVLFFGQCDAVGAGVGGDGVAGLPVNFAAAPALDFDLVPFGVEGNGEGSGGEGGY